jgi:hypothetical protein
MHSEEQRRGLGLRFETRGILGHGRLGTVYRAFDRQLEIEVALKVLRAELFPDETYRNRLLAACTQAQRLTHPRLVRVLHADSKNAYPFFAMEMAHAPTLRSVLNERIARGQLFTLAEVAQIISQLARALETVHSGLPAHGLLRPENIFILPGELKTTDYHLASCIQFDWLLSTQVQSGEPAYLAPEVQLGIPLSPASDVYSASAIAAELLLGTVPQQGQVRLTGKRRELPVSLDLLLARGLDEDPMARPETPALLAQSLRAFLEDDGGFRARARQMAGARARTPLPASRSALRSALEPPAAPALPATPVMPAAPVIPAAVISSPSITIVFSGGGGLPAGYGFDTAKTRSRDARRRRTVLMAVTGLAVAAAAAVLFFYVQSVEPAHGANLAVVTSPGARIFICEGVNCTLLGVVPPAGTLAAKHLTGTFILRIDKPGCEPRELETTLSPRGMHTFRLGLLRCAPDREVGPSAPPSKARTVRVVRAG